MKNEHSVSHCSSAKQLLGQQNGLGVTNLVISLNQLTSDPVTHRVIHRPQQGCNSNKEDYDNDGDENKQYGGLFCVQYLYLKDYAICIVLHS